MRRKRQQLSEEESIGILQRATAGTLALLGDGGYPYAVPISYVYADGKLYFHSALSGHKVDAIRNCDKASFCVIDKDDVQPARYTTFFRSVIAFGRIHIIEDEQEKLETARLLGDRYNPNQEEALQKELEHGFARMMMIRFDIKHLTGKKAIELVKLKTMDFTTHYQSPLGGITLASDGEALVGLWFDGQKYFADALDTKHTERDDLPIFDETRRWLDTYFSGKAPDFTPKLSMRASDFRKRVWEIMLTIPFGHTMTYGDIARQIARERGIPTMSMQAVGGAVSHNSISLIIPCHRVVGTGSSLTGYAGGIDKKLRLLQMEGALQPDFFVPKKGTTL